METLQLLGVALGLATLAGVNLYLTVFASGLAIHFHWITLPLEYQKLDVLGHPAVIVIAGLLYFIEFFADKIPWVDSLWDSVHTVIRPIGGALLAVTAIGAPNTAYDVIIALLGGSMSLASHTAKSGMRLVANGSPEPFSNIGLSLGGDLFVFGGLALILWNPVVALAVFLVLFLLAIWLLPIMLRIIRVKTWLAWRKLQQPAQYEPVDGLPDRLPHDCDILLRQIRPEDTTVAWAVKVISGRGKKIPYCRDGWLTGIKEDPGTIYFFAKKMFGTGASAIAIDGCKISHEPGFLQDDLVIYHPEEGWKCVFVLDRPRNPVAHALAEMLGKESKGDIVSRDAISFSSTEAIPQKEENI